MFLFIGAGLGVPGSSEVNRSSDIRWYRALGPQTPLCTLHSEEIVLQNRMGYFEPRGIQLAAMLSDDTEVEWFPQV
jgi:hypothetical protein